VDLDAPGDGSALAVRSPSRRWWLPAPRRARRRRPGPWRSRPTTGACSRGVDVAGDGIAAAAELGLDVRQGPCRAP